MKKTYIMCCISEVNQAVGDGRFAVELVGEVSGCDAFVCGRGTWLGFLELWPGKTNI